MEYQKVINLLDNTPNQPTNFRTKNWDEINDDAHEHITLVVKLLLKLQCCRIAELAAGGGNNNKKVTL